MSARLAAAVRSLGALFVMLLCGAGSASAAESVKLKWSAPSGCPTSAEVEAEIVRALARVRRHSPISVEAEVAENQDGFDLTLHLELEGEVSERALTVVACADVARAAALFVTLAIESKPEPPPPPPPPPAPPPERPTTVSFGPQVHGGITPRMLAGGGLSVAYSAAPLRLVARASAFIPSNYTVDQSKYGGDFLLLGFGALACLGGEAVPTLALWACLGAHGYYLSVSGIGTPSNFTKKTMIGAPVLAPEISWQFVPRWSLLIGGEAGYAPNTSRFTIENVGLVHETGHWLLGGRLEIGWSF